MLIKFSLPEHHIVSIFPPRITPISILVYLLYVSMLLCSLGLRAMMIWKIRTRVSEYIYVDKVFISRASCVVLFLLMHCVLY